MKIRHILRPLFIVALLFSAQACWAAPLETSFFSWEIPDAWTVERDASGQWQITAPGPNPLVTVVSAGRLGTTPELYLKGSLGVWRTQGEIEPIPALVTKRENQAWFLVKHHPKAGEKPQATIKWVRWRGNLLVVTNFKAPQSDLKSWEPRIQELGNSLRLKKPVYQEMALKAEAQDALERNQDTAESLQNLDRAKLALNVARQDWEPYFSEEKPSLYQAYIDYLEARYDATYAIVAGRELGMGRDVVDSRIQALSNRRDELRKQVHGF